MSVFHYHIIKFKNIVKSGHVFAARAILKGQNNHQSEWHFLSQCSFAQHSWFKIFLEGGATLREAEWRYILEFIRNRAHWTAVIFSGKWRGIFIFATDTLKCNARVSLENKCIFLQQPYSSRVFIRKHDASKTRSFAILRARHAFNLKVLLWLF